MKHLLGLLFCSLFFPAIYGQKVISDIFAPPTVLIQFENGGSGSGVIIVDTSYLYVVTARHVLFNFNKDSSKFLLSSRGAYVICYRTNAFNDSKDSLKLNLLELQENGCIRFHPSQDIAIIKIAKIFSHSTASDRRITTRYDYSRGVQKMRAANLDIPGLYFDLLIGLSEVAPGEDALILGYPKSLKLNSDQDYDYDRPLLRKGIISGLDNKFRTIIVDCPVYQGNSGGLALQITADKKVRVIGIVSRSILQVEILENKYYQYNNYNITNSGYTVITPIEFALELMKER